MEYDAGQGKPSLRQAIKGSEHETRPPPSVTVVVVVVVVVVDDTTVDVNVLPSPWSTIVAFSVRFCATEFRIASKLPTKMALSEVNRGR
ncbi:hypothetical protein [Sorangium sp. So ce363]|uniref:hypothetical protein n=1 Tax=Sorangium sp. So ce363 TaxID=3133304 RepID=UPI003F61DE27